MSGTRRPSRFSSPVSVRLPVRVIHQPDEPAYGLFERLAHAHGVSSASRFASWLRIPMAGIYDGTDIDRLATLNGTDPEALRAATPSKQGSAIVYRGQELRAVYDWSDPDPLLQRTRSTSWSRRVCCECLAEDDGYPQTAGRPSRAHRRAWWDFRWCDSCVRHSAKLVSHCPAAGCGRPLGRTTDLCSCPCGYDLRRYVPERLASSDMHWERYCLYRLGLGFIVRIPFLDQASLGDAGVMAQTDRSCRMRGDHGHR